MILCSGVKRFVYISAADFGVINYLIRGYFQGKVLSSPHSLPCLA